MHHILIFGDSISAGRNVKKTKSWPFLLMNLIDKKNCKFALIHNLSIAGNTTTDLISRFPLEMRERYNNISDDYYVIFAIGINDSKGIYKNYNNKTLLAQFALNLESLIIKSKLYTKKICFIGLTPVNEEKMRNESIPLTNKNIIKYNNIIKKVCDNKKISFINIFDSWFFNKYAKFIGDDGIHPNELGHKAIFQIIQKKYLKNNDDIMHIF